MKTITAFSKKKKGCNSKFVKKIQKSRKQAKMGKVSSLDVSNLWKQI